MHSLKTSTKFAALLICLAAAVSVSGSRAQMSIQIVEPSQQAEEFGGIGAVINKDQATGQMVVAELLPNGAAAKAGMLQGDIIAEVNGVATQSMELASVIGLIRGPVGSSVEVAVSRGPAGGPLQRFSIIRELVKLGPGGNGR